MSFVKGMLGGDNKEEPEEEDETASGEDTSTSSDTGFFGSPMSSDSLDLVEKLDEVPQLQLQDADCSTISNFFGYW
nr:unnamed protein product [Callosobruchus analis]